MQQIGCRAEEAATWQMLGLLAEQLGNPVDGLRLIALCYLIDRKIGHGDMQSDYREMEKRAAQLHYTPEQLATVLRETEQSYATDRGATRLKQAFP